MKKHLYALSGLTLALTLSACGGKKKSSSGYGGQGTPTQQTGEVRNGGINNGPTPVQNGGGTKSPSGSIEPVKTETGSGGNLPAESNRPTNTGKDTETDIEPPVVAPGAPASSQGGGSQVGTAPRPRPSTTTQANDLAPWFAPEVEGTPAEAWLYHVIDPALKSVRNAGPAARTLKGRVQLTLALGYFDGDAKNDFRYDGVNYGRHAAVDPFLRAAVEQVLSRECQGSRQQLCGFELLSTNDIESFYRREGEGGLIQEIRVLSGAVSALHDENVGRGAKEQLRRSERAEQAFMKAFETSEVVFYIGHSRKGGGPDFRPPRLKNDAVDYASYAVDRSGAKRTVKAVKGLNRRAQSLALLSCDSTEHFLNEVRQAGPNLELATVKGPLRAEELVTAGLLGAELFLRQGSLRGFNDFVLANQRLAQALELRLPNRVAQR